MNGRMIRYRKPGWKNWATIVVAESDYDRQVAIFLDLGYEVEGH